ncbi:hypothetical protein HYX05_02300 [Candidatus Woesearchaeota archaeon]|nr:hypothetical protein [Candidatus Woesearchaeota archaeon]
MNKKIIVLGAFLLVLIGLFSSVAIAADVFGDASDVSIDRVKANGKSLAEGRTNFIEDEDEIDIQASLTATEDISNMHVEAILTDLTTGNTVADSTGTFTLRTNQSTLVALNLKLIDFLKRQKDFRLEIRIVDVEGGIEQKSYGIKFTGAGGGGAGARGAEQLDVSIDSVQLEGNALAENENNFVIIDKGERELDLKVRLTSLSDIEDAHVDAVLAFENGDVVADATLTFDIADGENAVKDLELPLISKFEQNSFRLKVKVTDAEGDSEEKLYGLKISQKKFPFVISSVELMPENGEAGKNLIARLSFKNSGVVPLEGINAKVSIPELGISSTKFADRIKNSGLSEVSEDFVLKILDSTPTGTYTLRSEIVSQFGGDSEVKEMPVFVLGKDEQSLQIVNDKLVINIPVIKQDIYNDGSEVIYPITLTNEGPDANAYTLLMDGASWADLRLSESNTFILKPKESKTMNIFASTNADAAGEQIFLVTIKTNDGVLKQIPLKGNVVAAKGLLAAKLKDALEVVLILTVIFLAAIGLFFGVKKYMESNGSEEASDKEIATVESEPYYY